MPTQAPVLRPTRAASSGVDEIFTEEQMEGLMAERQMLRGVEASSV